MYWIHLAEYGDMWQALTNMEHVEVFSFISQEIQICCCQGCDGILASFSVSKLQFYCVFYGAFLYFFEPVIVLYPYYCGLVRLS
jgi:hypothetical protein